MIISHVKAELRQLPLMLGKLLGGIAAIAGFTMAVVVGTRKAGSTFTGILPFLLMGGAGTAIFAIVSKLLDKHLARYGADTPESGGSQRESMMSWGILLLFVLIFLLCTYLMTK